MHEYLRDPQGIQGMPPGVYDQVGEEPPPPVGAEVYVPSWFSPSDLLDLPFLERQVATRLLRRGPADAAALAEALGQDPDRVGEALSALVQRGHVCLDADGQARAVLGRAHHRQVPDQIWTRLTCESDDQDKAEH